MSQVIVVAIAVALPGGLGIAAVWWCASKILKIVRSNATLREDASGLHHAVEKWQTHSSELEKAIRGKDDELKTERVARAKLQTQLRSYISRAIEKGDSDDALSAIGDAFAELNKLSQVPPTGDSEAADNQNGDGEVHGGASGTDTP